MNGSQVKTRARFCAALLAMVSLVGSAAASEEPGSRGSSDPAVEKLAELVVKAMPIGELFQTLIDRSSTWPWKTEPSSVSSDQLACVRKNLSSDGYRDLKLAQTQTFAAAHPDRVSDAIRVLEQGGAQMLGAGIRAGADESTSGKPTHEGDLLAQISPSQLANAMELLAEDKFRSLRELIGIGDVFQPGAPKLENKTRGQRRGTLIGMKLVLGAMQECNVPLKALENE